jgi:hypothetical protein
MEFFSRIFCLLKKLKPIGVLKRGAALAAEGFFRVSVAAYGVGV